MLKTTIFFLFAIAIVQINAQKLEWFEQLPAYKMCTDKNFNKIILGRYYNNYDLDPGPGKYVFQGNTGCPFIQKLDANKNFVFAIALGDSMTTSAISTDSKGNIIVCGEFTGTLDFDKDKTRATTKGIPDLYMLKLDSIGTVLWLRIIKSNYRKSFSSAIIDHNDDLVCVGSYSGLTDFDPDSSKLELTPNYSNDIFYLKINSKGSFEWVKTFGVSIYYYSYINQLFLVADSFGNYYTSGSVDGYLVFNKDSSKLKYTYNTNSNFFVSKMDKNGNIRWLCSSQTTGKGKTSGNIWTTPGGMAIDKLSNIYLSGGFLGDVDFDLKNSSHVETAISGGNGGDAYLLKLDSNANFTWVKIISGVDEEQASLCKLDDKDNVYLGGYFTSQHTDFDPGKGIYSIKNYGYTKNYSYRNAFIVKLDENGEFVWARTFPSYKKSEICFIETSGQDTVFIGADTNTPIDIDPSKDSTIITGGFLSEWVNGVCDNNALIIDKSVDLSCGNKGYAASHIKNGLAPYRYRWNTNPISSDSATFFKFPGFYNIEIKDANECSKTTTILIGGPDSLNGFDLNANLVARGFRPGFQTQIDILGLNKGCSLVDGNLYLLLNKSVHFDSASIQPSRIAGDTLIWFFKGLQYSIKKINPKVYVTTDKNAKIGDKICFKVFIDPIKNDVDSANNNKNICYSIVNSFDPNIKEVYPKGLCRNGYIVNKDPLSYTIHFQNTGNADAVNIEIIDTLDKNLNIQSLEITDRSHQGFITQLLDSQTVKFVFTNIYLPDSLHNEPKSHGYIIFNIQPLAGVKNGTIIKNSSAIYFDFNKPVYTNTVFNTIVDTLPRNKYITTKLTCDSLVFNGIIYKESGTYIQHLESYEGCDSTILLKLVNQSSKSTITESSCKKYTYNNITYNKSGIYFQKINNTFGCDSTICLILQIKETDTAVIKQSDKLTATDSMADSFQWLDCSNNFTSILGETFRVFKPKKNGNYAVAIFKNNCTDTSNCYLIESLSNRSKYKMDISVSPNPINDVLNVNFPERSKNLELVIYNNIGSLLENIDLLEMPSLTIPFNYTSGIFLIIIRNKLTNEIYYSSKFVKE